MLTQRLPHPTHHMCLILVGLELPYTWGLSTPEDASTALPSGVDTCRQASSGWEVVVARIGEPDRWWYEPADSPLSLPVPEEVPDAEPAQPVSAP